MKKITFKEVFKPFALPAIGIIILFSGSAFVNYYYVVELEEQRMVNSLKRSVEFQRHNLIEELRTAALDLALLAQPLRNNPHASKNNGDVLSSITRNFGLYCSSRDRYDKMRLINSLGKEVLRVDCKNGQPKRISENSLKQEQNRYNIEEIFEGGEKKVIVSNLENRTKTGADNQFSSPNILLLLPLRLPDNGHPSLIALNYSLERLLNGHSLDISDSAERVYLGSRGNWVRKNNQDRLTPLRENWFGKKWDKLLSFFNLENSDKKSSSDNMYSLKLTQFEKYLANSSDGLISYQFGLIAFDSINPNAEISKLTSDILSKDVALGGVVGQNRPLHIVAYLSKAHFLKHANGFWSRFTWVFPLFFLFPLGFLWFHTRSRLVREAMKSAIIEGEKRFLNVIDNVADGLVVCDTSGQIVKKNLSFENYFPVTTPLSSKDIINHYVTDDSVDGLMNLMRHTKKGHIFSRGEFIAVNEQGKKFPVEVTCSSTTISDEPYIIASFRDLSAFQKAQSELDEYRLKYFHQEKMAELGFLVAGVMHEVGNPVTAIQGLLRKVLSQLKLDMDLELDRKTKKSIDLLMDNVEHLVNLTRDFSEFVAKRSGEFELLDMNALVRSTMRLMKYDNRLKAIRLDLVLDDQVRAVYGRRDLLMQVLINLVINAAHACHDQRDNDGIITIATRSDTDFVLSVSDNGVGIDDEIIPQIFDAFFTTKEPGTGTGLGLPLCEMIVKEHKGEIKIESSVGEGTVVSVHLPLKPCLS